MSMLGFPLLLIPFAIYNIVAFLMPGVSWTGVVTTVRMASGADWTMPAGDMLIALAILLLRRGREIDPYRNSYGCRPWIVAHPVLGHVG